MPCTNASFEIASDGELGQSLFEENAELAPCDADEESWIDQQLAVVP